MRERAKVPDLLLVAKIVGSLIVDIVLALFAVVERFWPSGIRKYHKQYIEPHQWWAFAIIIIVLIPTLLGILWPETRPQINILEPKTIAGVSEADATSPPGFQVEGLVTGISDDASVWIAVLTMDADREHNNWLYIQDGPVRLVPFYNGHKKWFVSVCIDDTAKMGTRFLVQAILANEEADERLREVVYKQQNPRLRELPRGAEILDWVNVQLK